MRLRFAPTALLMLLALPSAASAAAVAYTGVARDVLPRQVTVTGFFVAGTATTTASVEYGTTASYGATFASLSAPLAGAASSPVTIGPIVGLAPGTTYHYRVTATESGQPTVAGTDATFTTPIADTALVDKVARPFDLARSQLGRLTRDGTVASCGTSKAYPGVSSSASAFHYVVFGFTNASAKPACITVHFAQPAAGGCALFSAAYAASYDGTSLVDGYLGDSGASGNGATGLDYSVQVAGGSHFEVVLNEVSVGSCTAGSTYSLRVESSGLAAPRAGAGFAVATGPRTALLAGAADARSVNGTSARFVYGRTTAYGFATPSLPLVADDADRVARAALSGLRPATSYHYRIVVSGPGGTAVGADAAFTTPHTPAPTAVLLTGDVAAAARSLPFGLACIAGGRCSGAVTVRSVGRLRVGRVRRQVTLGAASFDISSGASRTVRVAVTRADRALLHRLRSILVSVRIVAHDADSRTAVRTVRLRLRG